MEGIEGQVVVGLSVLVLAWYFVGQQAMRRRGVLVLQWVRAGAHLLGESSTLRWLGRSAFQLTIERPVHPFKAITVTIVLEPREIVFMWLVNRFRQRRDLLVVRGDFATRPRAQFELFRDEGRSGSEAKAIATSERWPIESFGDSGLLLASSSLVALDALRLSTPPVQAQLGALIRLSIRDASPHLLLNYTLRPGREGNADQVFHFLLDVARAVLPTRQA